MAAVPVILNGVMYPKARSGHERGRSAHDEPVPCVINGYLSIEGLEIGGGPIIPPDQPPVDPPIDPPEQPPAGPTVAVVVKPAPVTGGWGIATDTAGQQFQWFFTPGEGGAGPKR